MATKDKPKIKGLSFNLFAIAAFLILLPISTAFISNLAHNSNTNYESLNEPFLMNTQDIIDNCNNNDSFMISWIDKGTNSTDFYKQLNTQADDVDNNGIPDGQDDSSYSSIWNPQTYAYQRLTAECIEVGGFGYPTATKLRNSDIFIVSQDNHAYLNQISGWHGYVGDSGNEFSFKIHDNYFQYLDSNQDISALKLTFVDYEFSFACDSPVFQEISYSSDITFNYKNQVRTFENFDFEKTNKYKVRNLPAGLSSNSNGTSQLLGEICHVAFVLEYKLQPYEAIELNELIGGDYSNLSAIVDIYDLDYDYNYQFVSINNNQIGQSKSEIAFLGDGQNGVNLEVAYQDTASNSFFLRGGAFIIGIGLFALAIASTPYWNPITGAIKKSMEGVN